MIADRYKQIKDYERYLYDTGTRVVKIFLNVSKDEQAKRFISRIDTEKKNWKVSISDIKEREHWDEYMEAFEAMVNKTSTKDSPWYVVPSDHKWYSRLIVSRIILDTLKKADPKWPVLDEEEFNNIGPVREELVASLKDANLEEEDMPELFKEPERIAEALYVSDEKDKIDAKTRKKKQKITDNINMFVAGGNKAHTTDEFINACLGNIEKGEEE